MGRPNIKDNPVFVEGKNMLAPLKSVVDEAKVEAAVIVKRAEDRVRDETLAIVRHLKNRGLSDYGVGLLTGVTRHDLLKALIERAFAQIGEGFEPTKFEQVVKVAEGYKIGVRSEDGKTRVVHPGGAVYTFEWVPGDGIVWRGPNGAPLTFDEQMAALTLQVEDYAVENVVRNP